MQFDPGKVKISEGEFEGKNSKRVHYSVIDPKQPLEGEKLLPMSLTNAININALLKKGLLFWASGSKENWMDQTGTRSMDLHRSKLPFLFLFLKKEQFY